MRETDRLPGCQRCGGSRFRRDSIFEEHQGHEHVATVEIGPPEERKPPAWLPEARRSLSGEGRFIVHQIDDGSIATHEIRRGWTRIGRSANSDICLDDPTVSRRHALIVAEPGKDLRVLDDRSLNGVFVNGERIEWRTLTDGDEIVVGRYRLQFLEVAAAAEAVAEEVEAAG